MSSVATRPARAADLLWVAFVVLGLLIGQARTVLGQSQAIDGTIEGFVRTANDPVPEVSVQVTNVRTGYERTVTTDAGGRYFIPLLPPGEYVIQASKQGFATVTRANLDVSAGRVLTIEIDLSSTTFAETLEVTTVSPTIEVGRTVVSNTLDERTVRALPLQGRSIQDFYIVQPGVNAGPPDGGSGSGTPTISTVYGGLGLRQMNVDGVSNNLQGGARNLVISEESVAEFQTVTNFSAEFGRVAGGLQNAVTRSGSNAVKGSAYLFTRQKFLNAAPFLQAPGTPKPDFSRYNFGGTLGGPLVANRVFYFVNYERWMADAPTVSTFNAADAARLGISPDNVGTYPAQFRAHTVTGKVDVLASANHRVATRYFYYYDRESPNTFGGNQTRDTAARFDEEPQSFTTQLVSILRRNVVNEARFLFASRGISNGVEVNPNNPNITISGVGSFNGNANGHRRTRERGYQFNENLSIVAGAHTFKAGIDILPVWFKERITNINGTFTFGGLAAVAGVRPAVSSTDQFILTESGAIDPATGQRYSYSRFTQSVGLEYQEARTINQGYYFQDDFRLTSTIKVNLGLRYELFSRADDSPNPILPDVGVFPRDTNNWAPRLSVAWDPFANGRDVIRAGYGIFHNMMTPQTFNTFLRGNGKDVLNVNVTPTNPGAPVFSRGPVAPITGVNVVSDIRIMDPDFQDIKVHEFFTSYDRELVRDLALSVTYRINRGRNLPVAYVTNLTPAGTLADGTRRWTTSPRPDPRFGNIFVSKSIGYQNYQGLVTVLTKRFSHGFSFQASHHWSKVTGAGFSNDFTGFGIFTSPSDPQDIEADHGTGDYDMPQRFVLTGVFEPQFSGLQGATGALVNGWQLAPRVVATKNYPFTAVTGLDNNGDTVFNDRPTGIGYNTFRVPGYYAIDLRLSRRFALYGNSALELIVEGFNLANQLTPQGASAVNRTWGTGVTPNATFGQIINSQASRQFQIAFRLTF
jgi:carboxypeptidase family protein